MASRAADNDCLPEFREWFTAAELADLALPGLPADKRSLNRKAQAERWSMRQDTCGSPLVRPRAGRGGGVEFHVSLLPGASRLELAKRGITQAQPILQEVETDRGGWRWYDAQSATVKAEAERRLQIVGELELLLEAGMTKTAAAADISDRHDVASSTVWGWLKLIKGTARQDRLPALAPRRQGGGAEAEIDPFLWSVFKSDYLRLSQATLTSVYARVAAIANERGLSIASERTFRRRLEREIDPGVLLLRRKGEEALRRSIPAQRRTVDHLHAMECVNIDGHKFDVFVKHPETGKPIRPMMVAIQDIHSRKMLAWRLAVSENSATVRLAFADLFKRYGIPKACLLDNGRGFASKWITGGAKSRYRFKVKDEDPTGLLTGLGIKIHWALPYRGQSKPIERAFRDLCDTVAKHPAMEGAYTGNSPMAKPENYGSKAIGWDEFVAHVERGINAHNARLGRKGAACRGRSFDEVFAESYATAPIGKATEEHLRLALLTGEQKLVNRQTGEVQLFGNRYWSPECGRLHGQRVTVRFDPERLHSDIHLYGLDGRYLCSAQLIADTGFLDVEGAKATAKRLKDHRRRIRDAAESEQLLAAEEVAALQADIARSELPEPTIVRPVRHRGQTAAALKAVAVPQPQKTEREDRVFAALRLVGDDD